MPTNLNGLFATLDQKYIDRGNLLVAYDFLESGQILNKAPNYSGSFSGQLSGSNSFFFSSGTGLAQADLVSIINSGAFYSSEFSHFFTISRNALANDNFFSSLSENNGIASGYSIFSNSLGKLIFAYKDCSGPQSVTSDFVLNGNANFAVVKNGNVVSLYQYTPVFNVLNSFNGIINSEQVFRSDFADLFFGNQLPVGFIKDHYSGFITNYLYFNTAFSPNQVIDIFSGVYSNIVLDTTTGCTNLLPSFNPVTITGAAPTPITLNKNGIVLLKSFPTGSKILLDYTTGYDNVSWNNFANFDFNKGNFTTIPSTIPPITYLNGQRVVSGVTQITGLFCATGRAWSRDYNFSGQNEIVDADSYDAGDIVVYDTPQRHLWQHLTSGTGSVNLLYAGSGLGVYLNGQRVDNFTASGATLTIGTNIGLTDLICIDYYQLGYEVLNEIHSSGFLYTSGAFAEGTSRVYLNGIRQALGIDYLEVVSGTMLTNSPLEKPLDTVVEITDQSLWNL